MNINTLSKSKYRWSVYTRGGDGGTGCRSGGDGSEGWWCGDGRGARGGDEGGRVGGGSGEGGGITTNFRRNLGTSIKQTS